MRPTISSQNKIIMNKSNLSRRRSTTSSQSTSKKSIFILKHYLLILN